MNESIDKPKNITIGLFGSIYVGKNVMARCYIGKEFIESTFGFESDREITKFKVKNGEEVKVIFLPLTAAPVILFFNVTTNGVEIHTDPLFPTIFEPGINSSIVVLFELER